MRIPFLLTRSQGGGLQIGLQFSFNHYSNVFLSMRKLSTGMMIRIDIIDISFTTMIVQSAHRKHPSRFSPQIASYKLQVFPIHENKTPQVTPRPVMRDSLSWYLKSLIQHLKPVYLG